jgi:hypothetical protein
MKALFQASVEDRYRSINELTVGIIFLGTPHRGSEKASYGRVLANVATAMMNKPTSRLVSTLQSNSDSLMRLTSDFKSQLPNYQVASFYETKPMKWFSTPVSLASHFDLDEVNTVMTQIVEKCSALLEVHGEDQIPVDANHRDMCKFGARDDPVYEKVFKRIIRMLKMKDEQLSASRT